MNKLWLIRLVWVTAVALQLLLNTDMCNFESPQKESRALLAGLSKAYSRPRLKLLIIPQSAMLGN